MSTSWNTHAGRSVPYLVTSFFIAPRQRIEPPTVHCVWLKHHFCAADQLLFELSDTAPRRITQSIVIVRTCYSLRINSIAAENFSRLLL